MAPMSAAMHSVAPERQLPLQGQLPLGSAGFQAADERAFLFQLQQQQQQQKQMGVQQQLDNLQAMAELRGAQIRSSRPISPPDAAGEWPGSCLLVDVVVPTLRLQPVVLVLLCM